MGINIELVPLLAITVSALWGKFSTRFWSVSVGILAHSFKTVFMRSDAVVTWESLAHNVHSSSSTLFERRF